MEWWNGMMKHAPVAPKLALLHKLGKIKSPVKEKKLSGYGIIEMKTLSNVFSMALCPICQCETLLLDEGSSKLTMDFVLDST